MALPTATRPAAVSGQAGGRLPRSMHPLSWWAWALGLMVAASRTTNPLILSLLLAVLTLVVVARRPDAPWAGAYAASLRIGIVIVVLRTLLQVLVGVPVGTHPALTLPQLELPEWMAGVRLGGLVTWESVVLGLCEGLRLATMVACVGAANSLSAPSRLLRSVPAALYHIGVAVVVALSFAPHVIDDARRVRAARRLRGHEEGRLAGFARSAGPVLDGGLDRSIRLAAAMDARGYGRTGEATANQRRHHAALVLGGFAGALIGLYGLFDAAAPRALGWPLVGLGALLAIAGLHSAGRRSQRTQYRPEPWQLPEWLTAVSGLVIAVTFLATPSAGLAVEVTPWGIPDVPGALLVSLLLGAGPALWSPPTPGARGPVATEGATAGTKRPTADAEALA